METVGEVRIAAGGGLEGDHKGLKFPNRGVTVLAAEDWQAAIDRLTDLAGPVPLAWTVRRANILVSGLRLPRAKGALLRLGPVLIQVTAQTVPCRRMEEAHTGLLKALMPDWRGGITARVIEGGLLRLGDRAVIVSAPPDERPPRLPG